LRAPVLLSLMSTAALGAASAMLAFGKPLAMPFAAILGRDLALLIQLPAPLALLVLVAGAAIVERVAERMRVKRPSVIAATHLGLASLLFVAYASFPLAFWPAFAENRFDLGFDLRSASRWVITSWFVYLLVALALAATIMRTATATSASRAPRTALVAVAIVTCISTLVAARRLQAQPGGYLATLSPITLEAEGPPLTQLGSLCIWRGERAIAWSADRKVKLHRCTGGLSLIHTCDPLLANADLFGPLTDDVERGVSVAQLQAGASCSKEATPDATRREPGTRLLYDAKHDVFFEPSKYHGGDSGYLSQLAGREIVTMRDVGAPPPRMLVYSAIVALVLALALEVERMRGRSLRPSSVAIVAAFAAPLVVATIIGA
jgi:hypothetical protein